MKNKKKTNENNFIVFFFLKIIFCLSINDLQSNLLMMIFQRICLLYSILLYPDYKNIRFFGKINLLIRFSYYVSSHLKLCCADVLIINYYYKFYILHVLIIKIKGYTYILCIFYYFNKIITNKYISCIYVYTIKLFLI